MTTAYFFGEDCRSLPFAKLSNTTDLEGPVGLFTDCKYLRVVSSFMMWATLCLFTVTRGPRRDPAGSSRCSSPAARSSDAGIETCSRAGRMLRPTPPTPKSVLARRPEFPRENCGVFESTHLSECFCVEQVFRGERSLLPVFLPPFLSGRTEDCSLCLREACGHDLAVGAVVKLVAGIMERRRGDDVIREYDRRPGPLLRDNLEGVARKNMDGGSRRRSRPGKPIIEEARDLAADLLHSHRTVVRDIVLSRSRPRMPMIEPSLKIMDGTVETSDPHLPSRVRNRSETADTMYRTTFGVKRRLGSTGRPSLGTRKTMIAELPFGMCVWPSCRSGPKKRVSRCSGCGSRGAIPIAKAGRPEVGDKGRGHARHERRDKTRYPLPADVRKPGLRRTETRGRGHAYDTREHDSRTTVRDEEVEEAPIPIAAGHARVLHLRPIVLGQGSSMIVELPFGMKGSRGAIPIASGRPEVGDKGRGHAYDESMIAEPPHRSRPRIPMNRRIAFGMCVAEPPLKAQNTSGRAAAQDLEDQNRRIAFGMCVAEPPLKAQNTSGRAAAQDLENQNRRIAFGMCVAESPLKAQNTSGPESPNRLRDVCGRVAAQGPEYQWSSCCSRPRKPESPNRLRDVCGRVAAQGPEYQWSSRRSRPRKSNRQKNGSRLCGSLESRSGCTRRTFINMTLLGDVACHLPLAKDRGPFFYKLGAPSLLLYRSLHLLSCRSLVRDGSSFNFLSASSSSSPSVTTRVAALPSSPASNPSSDAEAARALEALMWPHDQDSILDERMVGILRRRYGIPEEFNLLAAEAGQRAFDPVPKGFALTADALEAGLRLPLHPFIVSCISLWRILPSQITPNSWRYLVAFLGECHYANIVPTRNLFLSCFRLFKGSGGYFLAARPGFRVSGAPTNNKGWKKRFFFVQCQEDWGFGVRWSSRTIDNTARPKTVRVILPSSEGIRNMSEHGGGGRTKSVLSMVNCGPSTTWVLRGDHLRAPQRSLAAGSAQEKRRPRAWWTQTPAVVLAGRRHRAPPLLPSAGPGRGGGKGRRPPAMKDLLVTSGRIGSPSPGPSDPLVARWHESHPEDKVWVGGEPSASYLRGALHPDMARDLYTLPSEALIAKSAKSVLWNLHYTTPSSAKVRVQAAQLELRAARGSQRAGPAVLVARTTGADMGAGCASTAELEAPRRQAGPQKLLRTSAENRLRMEEASGLAARLTSKEAELGAAREALAAAERSRPEKDREAVDAYKKVSSVWVQGCPGGSSMSSGSVVVENPFVSCPEGSVRTFGRGLPLFL
ncbi:Putative gypsy type transposon [Musa troglodytarum]|uniref:Gypsy type transposon n=1 Tax=Musa troglodytarum TaxID=320322 RepID=A0A9E7ED23_9LILI|nr:Putative gypsy type transposon [Musa troglodytarum]